CRTPSPSRPSSPPLPAPAPPRRLAPPHPRPPHSRSPRPTSVSTLLPTAGAAPRRPRRPLLDHHPTPAQDIWGQRAIAMPTLTLAPSKLPLRVRARFTGEPGPGRTPAAPAEVALVVPMPLRVKDVRIEDEVRFFDFVPTTERGLKTASSRR